jgi:hypothetical protein
MVSDQATHFVFTIVALQTHLPFQRKNSAFGYEPRRIFGDFQHFGKHLKFNPQGKHGDKYSTLLISDSRVFYIEHQPRKLKIKNLPFTSDGGLYKMNIVTPSTAV